MRTIKFRALDMNGEQWVYGYYHEDTADAWMYTEVGFVQVDKKTVGQFTGLLDTNGKEIYEGDVVKVKDEDDLGRFPEGNYEVRVSADGVNWNFGSHWFAWIRNIDTKRFECEVLGNIYENPELLKS